MKQSTRTWISGLALLVVLSYSGVLAIGALLSVAASSLNDWFGDKGFVLYGLAIGMLLGCLVGVTIPGLRRFKWSLRTWLLKAACVVTTSLLCTIAGVFAADWFSPFSLLLVPLAAALAANLVLFEFKADHQHPAIST